MTPFQTAPGYPFGLGRMAFNVLSTPRRDEQFPIPPKRMNSRELPFSRSLLTCYLLLVG